jgi:hypothetical protein
MQLLSICLRSLTLASEIMTRRSAKLCPRKISVVIIVVPQQWEQITLFFSNMLEDISLEQQ